MHLLAGEIGRIDDGDAAIDLDQSPGDIIILSSADSELAALAAAAKTRPADAASLRLANPMRLSHPLSVDLYVEKTAAHARLVVVRQMGGVGYWPYGLERLRALSRSDGPALAVIPGEDRWDETLEAYSTVGREACRALWRYLVEAGPENVRRALDFAASLVGSGSPPAAADALPQAGYYWPGEGVVSAARIGELVDTGRSVAPIVFYRSILLGAQTAPIDALVECLAAEGLAPLPVFVASLKDVPSQALIDQAFAGFPPAVVLNTTAFAVSRFGALDGDGVLDRAGRPVLQVVLAGSSEDAWRESRRGLFARDLTMNVVLPEVDGRLLTRAVSFKAEEHDPATDSRIATYRPVADRVAFVAAQAERWVRLAATPANRRRVAIVLSNYPGREGRLANAVGLDALESAVRLAAAMASAGYDVGEFPASGRDLVGRFAAFWQTGRDTEREGNLPLEDYVAFLATVPGALRDAMTSRWGVPESDGSFDGKGLRLPLLRFGNIVLGVQPARGDVADAKATYHDADLVPTHAYLAFYAWLRQTFGADAIVHMGKHGTLEWLPGKALGLSAACWPEIVLGPTPLVYPFIVNDPGEGSQAKRRSSAVIVDHLMPAMTRAELHGPLVTLEALIDEYYLAAGVDPRRRAWLEDEIMAVAGRHGLEQDLGFRRDDRQGALRALDAHLCELKELQIRDGLHTLGDGPEGRQRIDTLVALARVPRPGRRPEDESLHRAIADDLGLGFDPLAADLAEPWSGPRPSILAAIGPEPWRTAGDAVARIEALAARLVADGDAPDTMRATRAVLSWIASNLAPRLDRSGDAEIAATLAALDGRFVRPGPSGAPTRGRPDVLPTGRNFYAVDVRAVPTPAAWSLGRAAADALALRFFQDEGCWPRSIALSAWGTSNMRTGGDDIAEVMALVGAAPLWEPASGRVTGFRILPLAELGRPRIDVTLRISGMFRDAFPTQIDLLDSAIRAIADLEEDDESNPMAAARQRGESAARIFGAPPGSYGAGLGSVLDHGSWRERKDLAGLFLAWSSHAYGAGADGEAAAGEFAVRLKAADAVLHNQDNREHDILDSDEYNAFHGGLAAAVESLRGHAARLYFGDHSRPETPKLSGLAEEIARVVRGRAANPKWIAGAMRHGYRGAAEMAATVDHLFAYAALTDAVSDHHFDQLFDAYLGDDAVRAFIGDANPAVLADMARRFREAIDRGLWSPRANSAYDRLTSLMSLSKEAAE